MLMKSFLSKVNQGTKLPLGKSLGDGADGEVFEDETNVGQVIKLSQLLDDDVESLPQKFQVLKQIKDQHPLHLVKVFDFGEVCRGVRQIYCGSQEYVVYYCVMEKLFKLSEDEKKVFHTIISHEHANKKKDLSSLKIKHTLAGLSRGLDFNTQQVLDFCQHVVSSSINHLDIHVLNIMKDCQGNFKLTDLDRCSL